MENQWTLCSQRFQLAHSVYTRIGEVYETSEIEDAAVLLATNGWVMLAAARGLSGVWRFALRRIQ